MSESPRTEEILMAGSVLNGLANWVMPPPAKRAEAGADPAKQISFTRSGNIRLSPGLASMLGIETWQPEARQGADAELSDVATMEDVLTGINGYLEGRGIKTTGEVDHQQAMEVVVDIRRTLASGGEGELPIR